MSLEILLSTPPAVVFILVAFPAGLAMALIIALSGWRTVRANRTAYQAAYGDPAARRPAFFDPWIQATPALLGGYFALFLLGLVYPPAAPYAALTIFAALPAAVAYGYFRGAAMAATYSPETPDHLTEPAPFDPNYDVGGLSLFNPDSHDDLRTVGRWPSDPISAWPDDSTPRWPDDPTI